MTVTTRTIRGQFPFWNKATMPAPLTQEAPLTVVTGCGTSYNLALSIASAMNGQRIAAMAVPAGELVARPTAYFRGPVRVVALSRSGATTETVEAVVQSRARGADVIGVTCAPGSRIETVVDRCLGFETHPEEGIVMTASASLMLLAGFALAGLPIDSAMADAAEALLNGFARVPVDAYAGRAPFVFLGGGANYGVALEGALKLTEMAIAQTQAFHPGEYRHGPVSLIDEWSAAVMLYHEATGREEARLAEELMNKGAWVLGLGGPGTVSLPVTSTGDLVAAEVLPTLQLLGERFAGEKGIDTTQPRHLTKVVVLDE